MVWDAFTSSDRSPLVIMLQDERSATNFVYVVYEDGTLSLFYIIYDQP